MKKLISMMKLTLISDISQRSVSFVIADILKTLVITMSHMFVINVTVYQW